MAATPVDHPDRRVLSEVSSETKGVEKIVKGAIGNGVCTIPHPPFNKTVLHNLSSCNIAHSPCHGVSDARNSCNSHLLPPSPGGTKADPLFTKELSHRDLDRSMLASLFLYATLPTIRLKPS